MNKEHGFTLAEVLITIAIIGVVAAMTIPTLIAKINTVVTENQAKVFNAKLIKGMNLTKTAGDLNDTYSSTYEFLTDGLGKNLKMAKVCDSDHIRDCIPYDKIKYDKKDGSEDTINVADIKTAAKLNLKAPFTDVAAFVLADGTPVIASYNLQCIDDPDKADTTINACFVGIYDLNGTRKPNKFGIRVETVNNKEVTTYLNDLRAFNGASIGSSCAGQIGDVCLASTAILADDDMLPLIQAVDPSYTMPIMQVAGYPKNYWQLASDYCSKVHGKKLPTVEQLAQIATAIYYDSSDNGKTIGANDSIDPRYEAVSMKNKAAVYAALGLSENLFGFELWSSEYSNLYTKTRYFADVATSFNNNASVSNNNVYAICVD